VFRLLELGQLVALLLEDRVTPGVARIAIRLAVLVEESIDDIGALDRVGAR
jgi:hypothetical protein